MPETIAIGTAGHATANALALQEPLDIPR